MVNNQQRNASSTTNTPATRNKLQKIFLFTIIITIFLIFETSIIRQGITKFQSLKDESNQWRKLYHKTQNQLNTFHHDFHKDKEEWKSKIHDLRGNLKTTNDVHDKEELYWKDQYYKKKEDLDVFLEKMREEEE